MAGKHSNYDEELPKAMQHKSRQNSGKNGGKGNNMAKKKKKGLKVFGIIILILIILLVGILRNSILVYKW